MARIWGKSGAAYVMFLLWSLNKLGLIQNFVATKLKVFCSPNESFKEPQ